MAVGPLGRSVQIRKIRLPAIFKIRGSTVCLSWKMAEERSRTTFLQQCYVLPARPESAALNWRIVLHIPIHALFFNNAGWDELAFNANAGAIFVNIFQKISQVEKAPLMENQLLKTVGNRLPKCQGGAAELSTMVLGDGNELIALTADLFCSFWSLHLSVVIHNKCQSDK